MYIHKRTTGILCSCLIDLSETPLTGKEVKTLSYTCINTHPELMKR